MYPFEPYRLELGFKKDAWYGPHEGWDLNVKGTWGNQDCGVQLKAVDDGEVVLATQSSENYGNLLILRCETPRGTRWVRYAHCDQFVVKSGSVKRGDVLATIGDTGNSSACHLHIDILKKEPPYWRYYAKTKIDEYFEDPEVFFASENDKMNDIPDWLKTLLQERGLTIEDEGEIRAIFDRAKRYEDEVSELKEQVKSANEALAEKSIEVSTLTDKVTDLQGKVDGLQENLNKARSERDSSDADKVKAEAMVERLEAELEKARVKIEGLEGNIPLYGYTWWERFTSLFKGGD